MLMLAEPSALAQPVEVAGYGDLLLEAVLLVGAVLAAILVVWVVGRLVHSRSLWSRRGGARSLEVVERLPLEPRKTLYLVRVRERTLLLGASEQSVSLLGEVASSPDAAAELPRDAPTSFASLVARATERLSARRSGATPAAAAEVAAGGDGGESEPAAPAAPEPVRGAGRGATAAVDAGDGAAREGAP